VKYLQPVKKALKHPIEMYTTTRLNSSETQNVSEKLATDAIVISLSTDNEYSAFCAR